MEWLIKKLDLKVAFCHVLNHDIIHWVNRCNLLKTKTVLKPSGQNFYWTYRGSAIGLRGDSNGQRGDPSELRAALSGTKQQGDKYVPAFPLKFVRGPSQPC